MSSATGGWPSSASGSSWRRVQDDIDAGRVAEETGPAGLAQPAQTTTLLRAIEEHGFDAAFGGARRDEEKARAKERVFSFRDEFGQWDPKNQRPELWELYNGTAPQGRAHPRLPHLELDRARRVAVHRRRGPRAPVDLLLPPAYRCSNATGCCWRSVGAVAPIGDERPFEATVRYRTVGDMSCTGAVESAASTVAEIIAEVAATRITERGATRADDKFSEAAMEDRKKEGYF